jgi:hypothetical protein
MDKGASNQESFRAEEVHERKVCVYYNYHSVMDTFAHKSVHRGIDATDCIEKSEMLQRLYRHLGVTSFPSIPTATASRPSASAFTSDSSNAQSQRPLSATAKKL